MSREATWGPCAARILLRNCAKAPSRIIECQDSQNVRLAEATDASAPLSIVQFPCRGKVLGVAARAMLNREGNMKRPHFHLHKLDTLEVKTSLELAAGGFFTAVLMRWLM